MTRTCANCRHYAPKDDHGGQCVNDAATFERVGKDWVCGWWTAK